MKSDRRSFLKSAAALTIVVSSGTVWRAFADEPELTPEQIDLDADVRRNLGAFDPYLRETFFSLGCARENLALAGRANGSLLDRGDEAQPVRVAHIGLHRARAAAGIHR